jgi:hypothetical protein
MIAKEPPPGKCNDGDRDQAAGITAENEAPGTVVVRQHDGEKQYSLRPLFCFVTVTLRNDVGEIKGWRHRLSHSRERRGHRRPIAGRRARTACATS